jgi:hypothetical protein
MYFTKVIAIAILSCTAVLALPIEEGRPSNAKISSEHSKVYVISLNVIKMVSMRLTYPNSNGYKSEVHSDRNQVYHDQRKINHDKNIEHYDSSHHDYRDARKEGYRVDMAYGQLHHDEHDLKHDYNKV